MIGVIRVSRNVIWSQPLFHTVVGLCSAGFSSRTALIWVVLIRKMSQILSAATLQLRFRSSWKSAISPGETWARYGEIWGDMILVNNCSLEAEPTFASRAGLQMRLREHLTEEVAPAQDRHDQTVGARHLQLPVADDVEFVGGGALLDYEVGGHVDLGADLARIRVRVG